jgi:phosphoribosylaminoimidazole-succinocarboxamide synthase
LKLLAKGKVKEVYEIDESALQFIFTDNISVFDKIIPSAIPYKGETLCRTSAYWFKKASELGIHNHFIGLTAPNAMTIKRVRVIRDYSRITADTTNYLIPLEFICRHYVAGSLHDRIKNGTIKSEDLGFEPNYNVQYGDMLPEPFFEMTTKLEKTDTLLTQKQALKISGLAESDLREIKETVLKIDDAIAANVKQSGLIHVDGKKEFAFDEKRNLMLIDTFGTADEDRFWDAQKYEDKEFTEISKEFVRQYYRKTGYKDALDKARENNIKEPIITPLPDHVVQAASDLYIGLFQRLTGEKFR